MNDERCKQHVYGPREMQGHLCNKPVWKDGYCKIHHPDNVEARQAARDAKRDAEWAAQDKADAKSKCIERAERKVLKAAEARRDAGLCGHEDETQRATQHLLEVAVDRLKAARKHFQEFDMLYDYCYDLATGQQEKVDSLAALIDREREEAVEAPRSEAAHYATLLLQWAKFAESPKWDSAVDRKRFYEDCKRFLWDRKFDHLKWLEEQRREAKIKALTWVVDNWFLPITQSKIEAEIRRLEGERNA